MTNTSTTVVSIEAILYEPELDPDTGEYKDKNPYGKGKPKPIITCPCKCGTIITTYASFKQHIGTKTHTKWVENYAEEREKQKQNEKMKNDILKLKIKMGRLEKLNELEKKKYSSLEHRLSNKINKKNLQITELNETVRELTDINDDKDLIISELRNTLQTQDNYLDALSE
jgi:hypothetical protein